MYTELLNKKRKLAVVGLGYVGAPLAREFAGCLTVIGFDTDSERIRQLQQNDTIPEVNGGDFRQRNITFTASEDQLKEASFFIIAVPTPVDHHNQPDLTALLLATTAVAKVLQTGDYVVYESTVYPGCTEENCIPLLEKISGLRCGVDFKVGYSPERINPGDKNHTLINTVKLVSACDDKALKEIAQVYQLIITAGVCCVKSIKVAEAAKIIENTQRDVNIALMNELSILFDRMNINTYEVLEAAGTKWNFLPFFPGLVGGHCIGVDPYYLVYKARELNYHPQMINSGRFVNDSMGGYIGKKIVKKMIALGKNILGSRVLVMGVTFKENVSDSRNSKVIDIINELRSYGAVVNVTDPHALPAEVQKEYSLHLTDPSHIGKDYDAVIVAVAHDEYKDLTEDYFLSITTPQALLGDIKGIYRHTVGRMAYWSL